jgi:hypothetical protein
MRTLDLLRAYLSLPILGALASIIGIGAGAKSLFGGGSSSPTAQGSTSYVPQAQGTADQFAQQMMQQYGGAAGQAAPQIEQGLGQAYQATQPGGQFGNLGNLAQLYQQMLQGQAGQSYGQGQNLYGAGNQLWQTALDPQNALRDKMQQQVTDASRAGTSARGIGMGGEAAGIENQDVSNFLMNWQNAQLGRQAQGLQGMTGAYGGAGQQGQLGNAQLAGAMGMGQGGAQFPMQMANLYGQGMQTGVYSPYAQGMGMGSNYMGIGQQGGAQAFGQNQTGLGNLAGGLGGLGQSGMGNWLNNLFTTNQGQGYGSAGSQDPTANGTFLAGAW